MGHLRREDALANRFAGLCDRARRTRPGGQRGRTLLDARDQALQGKDKVLPPGTPVSTAEHPSQSFLWADYTAKAGTHYLFRIVPLHGTIENPELDDAAAVTLDVTTESAGDEPGPAPDCRTLERKPASRSRHD
jgi:hypothetical protein